MGHLEWLVRFLQQDWDVFVVCALVSLGLSGVTVSVRNLSRVVLILVSLLWAVAFSITLYLIRIGADEMGMLAGISWAWYTLFAILVAPVFVIALIRVRFPARSVRISEMFGMFITGIIMAFISSAILTLLAR